MRNPDRFAVVVPIAGGYVFESDEVPDNICAVEGVPTWVFHGDQDDVVLPRLSEVMVDALQARPGDVRFTLYPNADHDDAWKLAYSDPGLYEWLLEQSVK